MTVKSAPTSIEEVDGGNRVYPTVVRDIFYVDLCQAQTVYIINVSGVVCAVVPCHVGCNMISISAYPTGIYFIRFDDRVVKVVKK